MGGEVDLAWVAAGLAAAVALALAIRTGSEPARTRVLRDELEESRKQLKGFRKQQDQRDKALRRTESELEKATRKLGQVDKRVAQAKESTRTERRQSAERVSDLEAEIERLRQQAEPVAADLGRTREELALAVARAERSESQVGELRAQLAAKPEPMDPEELLALRARAEQAEQKLAEQEEPLGKAAREVERLKEKVLTQQTLYTSIRSELSLKKDQIRQQREEIERLRATKVALGATESD